MSTQLQSLIKKTIFMSLLSVSAFGGEYNCTENKDVLLRVGSTGYNFESKPLTDLKCNKTYEGKYFKVVKENTNEVISFSDDEEIQKRAANVYYHMMIARDFWVDTMKSDYVKNLDQLVIRIGIKNAFSTVGHFQHLKVTENYNNAWTVPAGKTPSFVPKQDSWGIEVWFSPAKKIPVEDIVQSVGNNPITQGLKELEQPVLNYTERRMRYDIIDYLVEGSLGSSAFESVLLTHLGTMAITYGSIFASKKMDHLFMEDYFYLDTAMVSDIIYHEFSHVALSDYIVPIHSVPVIEGMADYFATRIANRNKVYNKINGFSSSKSKDPNNKDFYHPYLELDHNADRDFALSLIWTAKKDVEKINTERKEKGKSELISSDQLVYEARKELNHTSDIMHGLTNALIKSCQKNCKNKRLGVSVLHRSFEKKGL